MNKELVKDYNYFGMTEEEWEQANAMCDLMCSSVEEDDDRAEEIKE